MDRYFNRLSIICSDGYIPSHVDIIYLESAKTSTVDETVVSATNLDIRLIDIGSRQHERKKNWISFFEDVFCVIYVVDLDTYDAPGETGQGSIFDSLLHFSGIISPRLGSRLSSLGSIILLLTNKHEFTSKLARSPLENYFPDYTGGVDPGKAAAYIAQRFANLRQTEMDFHAQLVDIDSPYETLRFVRSAVLDTIIAVNLKLVLPIR